MVSFVHCLTFDDPGATAFSDVYKNVFLVRMSRCENHPFQSLYNSQAFLRSPGFGYRSEKIFDLAISVGRVEYLVGQMFFWVFLMTLVKKDRCLNRKTVFRLM